MDSQDDPGDSLQVLSSTGTKTKWVDAGVTVGTGLDVTGTTIPNVTVDFSEFTNVTSMAEDAEFVILEDTNKTERNISLYDVIEGQAVNTSPTTDMEFIVSYLTGNETKTIFTEHTRKIRLDTLASYVNDEFPTHTGDVTGDVDLTIGYSKVVADMLSENIISGQEEDTGSFEAEDMMMIWDYGDDQVKKRVATYYVETKNTSAAPTTEAWSEGDVIDFTITSNSNLLITDIPDVRTSQIRVTQDATGNRALNLQFYSGASSGDELGHIVFGINVTIDPTAGSVTKVIYQRFDTYVDISYIYEN
jgi:hypothetical protein